MAIMINNILVPLDGSKNSIRGLDKAISLARQCHATITALYVKQMPGIYAIHPVSFLDFGSLSQAKKFLAEAKMRAAKRGIELTPEIISGDPGYDIIKYSKNKSNKIDIIVIGARGHSAAKEIFLGSTSSYVLHQSSIPILIVK